jgi:hypothetical protein
MRILSLRLGSHCWTGRTCLTVALLGQLAGAAAAGAVNYTWPLHTGGPGKADLMNTSFGPRVNNSKWDFHDGVDLPAPCVTTKVHAVAGGEVVSAGESGSGWSSRHVMIKVVDPPNEIYVVYLHLNSIEPSVLAKAQAQPHGTVQDQEIIGTVGDDGASYCHLHLEFRQGGMDQASSQHPLKYMPYGDSTANNFTVPVQADARFNRQTDPKPGPMAARLLFGAPDKNEGDLLRVDVDIQCDGIVKQTRTVDFDDKQTIHEGNSDDLEFMNDIAVEGYQSSNMDLDQRIDLKYGVIVRNLPLPADCNSLALVAKVFDVKGHMSASQPIPVPQGQPAFEKSLDFENGVPPAGWSPLTSTTGTPTSIVDDPTVAHGSAHSLLATDNSNTETQPQEAAIEISLDGGRFEWMIESWIRASVLDFGSGTKQVYLLEFLDSLGTSLSATARLRRNQAGLILAGIATQQTLTLNNSPEVIGTGSWCKWTLRLLRVGTRESTAVLFLDGAEKTRLSWDSSSTYEPGKVRIGIGKSDTGVRVILNLDDVLVTEKTL